MKLTTNSNTLIIGVSALTLTLLASCVPEPSNTPANYIINGPQDQFPAFSPDGEFIAYYHFAWDVPEPENYPTGLYIINKDGSDKRLVLKGNHYSPAWSPNGEWLVFSSGGIIQKCKTNGDSLTTFSELNHLDNPEFYFPDWSTDSKYIVFCKPLAPEGGLYYTTPAFLNAGRIFGLLLISGSQPELSPGGNSFVFCKGSQQFEGGLELFLIDTLGVNEIRLTINTRDDLAPTWSPDGQKIAWSSSVRICVMNADGTAQNQITYGNDPSWSVNNEIVYSHANAGYTKEVLYVIDPDGKNRRQITY